MFRKLSVVALSVCVIWGSNANCQTSTGPVSAVYQPDWSTHPNPESASDQVQVSSDIKQKRNMRFANNATPNTDLPQNSHLASRIYALPKAVSLFPSDRSDLVVVGVPLSTTAYMAANRSAVYTDMTLKVNKAWTRGGDKSPNQITILYPGGSITTNQGVTVRNDIASGTTPLDVGHEYLLFLSFDSQTASYNVLRAWDLSNTVPQALNQNGKPSRLPGTSEVKSLADLESRASLSGSELPAKQVGR